MLEFLLHAHHALAQFDLVDRYRLAEALIGEPLVFFGKGHGSCA
ncbi:hypothetical protein [Halochromatium salexigens]|nr:hypothetical protein [Halochromatium salexigens]